MNKLRIINGYLCRNYISLKNKLSFTPTKSIIKKILFQLLKPSIINTSCLDLFCGSGSLGIESLSMLASIITFVDINPITIKLLKKNLKRLNIPTNQYIIKQCDYNTFLLNDINNYNIIYIDPPFNLSLNYQSLITKTLTKLTIHGYIYLEYSLSLIINLNIFKGLKIIKFGLYGKVSFILLKKII